MCKHCKATNQIHRRDANFSVLSRGRNCLLAPEGVSVHGAHSKIPWLGEESTINTDVSNVGFDVLSQVQKGKKHVVVCLLQQHPFQGWQELLWPNKSYWKGCRSASTNTYVDSNSTVYWPVQPVLAPQFQETEGTDSLLVSTFPAIQFYTWTPPREKNTLKQMCSLEQRFSTSVRPSHGKFFFL
jgi:phage-related protein